MSPASIVSNFVKGFDVFGRQCHGSSLLCAVHKKVAVYNFVEFGVHRIHFSALLGQLGQFWPVLARLRILNKDPTFWIVGARSPPPPPPHH